MKHVHTFEDFVALPRKGGEFRISLFQNLPNQAHVIELIAVGDGEVGVKRFEIFEPPLR
ncbi:MAG: hypothetical protein U9N87_05930 [Planctomycetota bacterium]|nr:hypothetical protein [Planctomycetota bacterium]